MVPIKCFIPFNFQACQTIIAIIGLTSLLVTRKNRKIPYRLLWSKSQN